MHAIPLDPCAQQNHRLRPGNLPNLVRNTMLSAMEYPAGLPADVLYLQNTLEKGDVLLDVGTAVEPWMARLLSAVGRNGKVVMFEQKSRLCRWLRFQQRFFTLKNVEQHNLDRLHLPAGAGRQAAVFHFATGQPVGTHNPDNGKQTLDQFCQQHSIRPNVIRLGIDTAALGLLKGCGWLISKYRPAFVVQLDLQAADSRQLPQMLQWMSTRGYNGYFLLDTLKIPIVNFDARLYQNAFNNFYCDQFVFE